MGGERLMSLSVSVSAIVCPNIIKQDRWHADVRKTKL
jgi:hypothetical protein